MNLYRNFLSVGVLTLLSRLLGFIRDVLMAQLLGTGPAADAFFAAFRFPNLFRRLFAEGAFNTAFVPMFAGAYEQNGSDSARDLASRIISWLFFVLLALTILGEIFMDQALLPFVPGFADDPEKFQLTVLLTRICFPYLMLMSMMAAYAGILNSINRFTAAALAPILLNVAMIAVLVPLILYPADNPAATATWVAWSAILGGVVQLALVAWAIRRAGIMPKLKWPKIDREVRHFWLLALPAIATGGITQINIFIGTIIASGADSAISYLYYADRLYQLPLGIIGIAIGTVLLPELSRHLKGNRHDQARDVQDQSIFLSMLLCMPAAAGLIVMAGPIVEVLYQRGAFDALAAFETTRTLAAFSIGLPAYVLIRVLQPGFFAREDTFTPSWIAAISVAVNIGLSLALFPVFLHVGIAIATSVAAWTNVCLLALILARRGHFRMSNRQWRQQGLVFAISLVLALALYGLDMLFAGTLRAGRSELAQMFALFAILGAGLVLYASLVHATRLLPLNQLLRNLRGPKP